MAGWAAEENEQGGKEPTSEKNAPAENKETKSVTEGEITINGQK